MILEHAKYELNKILEEIKNENYKTEEDRNWSLEIQESANQDILEIINIIRKQHHSGHSISYIMNIVNRLVKFLPLSPLTGEDNEWVNDDFNNGFKQNKRCPNVFKDSKTGICTDIDKIIVSDNGGYSWWSSGEFDKTITFPYLPPNEPKKIYIEYTDEKNGVWVDITDDKERQKKLYEEMEKLITDDKERQKKLLEK